MAEYEVDILSVKSIEALQSKLKKYKESLDEKARILAERLAELGVEIAKVHVEDLNAFFTGELQNSLRSENVENTMHGAVFAIITDSDHAAFVEFGTGQRGADSPYPYPLPDGVTWDYNVGQTIRYNSVKGTYYWFYPGDDGQWHYTEGMPSRPFMYLTSLDLAKKVVDVAKEVFGGADT